MTKHIFVTGGVVSSLGKGLTSASIGMLLEQRGLRVRMQKLDPYINVDPGTMSPYQHGEVYVLDDGSETDLDLGHYERFTNSPLEPRLELHYRPDLSGGDRKGAARRVPGTNRAGHSPHHQRDQGRAEQAGRAGSGRGHHRDRRHGGRHRKPALPGGHPPACPGLGQGELPLHPPDAGALSEGGGGTEDQAHATFGGPVAANRHPARYPGLPHRAIVERTTTGRRSPCSATCPSRP